MLIRTEGCLYSQGQSIDGEIIHPRDPEDSQEFKRYANLAGMRTVRTKR